MSQKTEQKQWKIAMLPRLQVDALVACFLLTYFGEEKFPGIKNAQYVFWVDVPEGKKTEELESEGYILIDIGGGRFDHHATLGKENEKCTSQMVAEFLGIHGRHSIKKLLEYARRDDLEGKGTLSKDPIDRAFGLSGLVNDLNRMLPDDQEMVVRTVMPLLLAHYGEEKKRAEDIPREYKNKLQEGKIVATMIQTVRGPVKVITAETDEIGMAGYLRGRQEIAADIVVQKMSSGHINIITQQKKAFDLSEIARMVRKAELKEKGSGFTISDTELLDPGRVAGIEEWYFDTRATTIQNGGIRPQWTTPTHLSLPAVMEIIKKASAIKL